MSVEVDAQALYARCSTARIPDALIDDAIELTLKSLPADEGELLAGQLEDEAHASMLRKEVTDVVILVTAAMEAPTETVFRDLVALVDPAPFDATTAPLKSAFMRKMADDALEEIEDEEAENGRQGRVREHLQAALQACGDTQPLSAIAA